MKSLYPTGNDYPFKVNPLVSASNQSGFAWYKISRIYWETNGSSQLIWMLKTVHFWINQNFKNQFQNSFDHIHYFNTYISKVIYIDRQIPNARKPIYIFRYSDIKFYRIRFIYYVGFTTIIWQLWFGIKKSLRLNKYFLFVVALRRSQNSIFTIPNKKYYA